MDGSYLSWASVPQESNPKPFVLKKASRARAVSQYDHDTTIMNLLTLSNMIDIFIQSFLIRYVTNTQLALPSICHKWHIMATYGYVDMCIISTTFLKAHILTPEVIIIKKIYDIIIIIIIIIIITLVYCILQPYGWIPKKIKYNIK